MFLKIYGETGNLKEWMRQRLLQLYDSGGCSFLPDHQDFFIELAALTDLLEKEIGLLMDRKGKVHGVFLGDHRSIQMPSQIDGVDSIEKLGFLHTHPNSSGHLSLLDETAFEQLGYAWIAALGVKNGTLHSLGICYHLQGVKESYFWNWQDIYLPTAQNALSEIWHNDKVKEEKTFSTKQEESVILVGVDMPGNWPLQESLEELGELVRTAGGIVVGQITQKRERPENATFIGQGKISEIVELIQITRAQTVVFDEELTGIQQRNLEIFLRVKVLDRTALILDIFSQRARSYEGKIQVELAQLQYQLTRLTGKGISMSRLGGGIGTRGPGETKLEVDRRRIHRRISQLEQKVREVRSHRINQREERAGSQLPVVALVGYTNAGKSTLLNYLTQSEVFAEDLLFATLDPTIRKLKFTSGRQALISDTVGFINKLPHKLIHAFKATLEEINEADLILQVIDISDFNWERKQEAVQKVLDEIGLTEKPRVLVFNKIDQKSPEQKIDKYLRDGDTFSISAKTGEGIAQLMDELEKLLFRCWRRKTFLFSYQEGDKISQLHEFGKVLDVKYEENAIRVIAEIPNQYEKMWSLWEKE